jgi:hypothetical protein
MDTLIGKAIVIFAINKVFRAKGRFPLLYRSGSSGIYSQNLTNRIVPQGKDRFPRKGQVVGVVPPQKPPLAMLLDAIGGGDKAVPA